MMRHLQHVQRQVGQLGQLARELAAATPQRSEGSDATGWVRIVLGVDGLPTEIHIRDGWQQRLEPHQLGTAVLDANRDAVRRAVCIFSGDVDTTGWWSRRADVDEETDDRSALAGAALPDPPPGRRRDCSELAEDVMMVLQRTQQSPGAPAPPDEAVHDAGPVVVEVGSGGLTSCRIDPRWAAHRDAAAITCALADALKRATVQRPETSCVGQKIGDQEINDLVGAALATLTSLTLPPTHGGDR